MTTARNACQAFVSTGAVVAVMALALQAADPPDFKADVTFTGSSLAGWHVLGQAIGQHTTVNSSAGPRRRPAAG